MSGLVRISSEARNVRHLLNRWQSRHDVSGAIYQADPSTLLLTADTSVEALEDLLRMLQGSETEVEIIWRQGDLLLA
jgi:hypothetical protein